MIRHFLQLKDLSLSEYAYLFERAAQIKREESIGGSDNKCLLNKVVTLIFDKHSTRTRMSFEVGVRQLGGQVVFLEGRTTQLARGESVKDSAKIIGAASDAIVLRTGPHQIVEEFSRFCAVPLINGLSDEYHPCQVASDIMTFTELRGKIESRKVTWIGDTNNMLMTWLQASKLFGFELCISSFKKGKLGVGPSDNCSFYSNPIEACYQSDLIVTDVWVSMNDGAKRGEAKTKSKLQMWKVSEEAMAAAKPDALFFHCLPSHIGEEVSQSVIEGPKSVVYFEALNRISFQKALIEYVCLLH
ncbi:ornithine carbamoyltransferase [Candidatus Tremblaya phenacola PAVE]|nr:ornithine carbamoyltransferase [Candidatus Tremblaya phenacola PAVE]